MAFLCIWGCLSGCRETTPRSSETSIVSDTQLPDSSSPAEISPENPFEDSLKSFFQNPLDFAAFKKQTSMLNGGITAIQNLLHSEPEPFKYYEYVAFGWSLKAGLNQPLSQFEDEEYLIVFSTWKPWDTPKARYYSSDNEILVGIQAKAAYASLDKADFVGKDSSEILAQFGPPHFTKQGCALYRKEDKLLVFRLMNDQVSWFKYYWLEDSDFAFEELPGEIFRWNQPR